MNRLSRIVLFAALSIAGVSATASADSLTIGGLNSTCATCQGSSYTLDIQKAIGVDLFAGDGVTDDTYLVTLTIDTTFYNGGGDYIDEVAVKISSGANAAKIIGAPRPDGVFTTDLSTISNNWTLLNGGINADGCSGSGSGFECSDWIGTGRAYTIPGATLVWQFYIDISGPLSSFDSVDAPSIKARYIDVVDGQDVKVGALVSEKVPEPTTLALLGVGMSLAAIRRRRAQR